MDQVGALAATIGRVVEAGAPAGDQREELKEELKEDFKDGLKENVKEDLKENLKEDFKAASGSFIVSLRKRAKERETVGVFVHIMISAFLELFIRS